MRDEKETSIPHMTSGMLIDRLRVGCNVRVRVRACVCVCACMCLEISVFIFIHIYGRNIDIGMCSNPL